MQVHILMNLTILRGTAVILPAFILSLLFLGLCQGIWAHKVEGICMATKIGHCSPGTQRTEHKNTLQVSGSCMQKACTLHSLGFVWSFLFLVCCSGSGRVFVLAFCRCSDSILFILLLSFLALVIPALSLALTAGMMQTRRKKNAGSQQTACLQPFSSFYPSTSSLLASQYEMYNLVTLFHPHRPSRASFGQSLDGSLTNF